MKRAIGLFLMLVGSVAGATDFYDQARVTSVTPIVDEYPVTRNECNGTIANGNTPRERGVAGALIGGTAGAILGNQVGGGNGRKLATAAGAIVGAITGDRVQNTGDAGEGAPQPSCRQVTTRETRINRYNVTYDYQGRSQSSVLPYDPGLGADLKVHVSVVPVR